jgi:formyl-CoA transferase/CoA:oxalate CoA-transferase
MERLGLAYSQIAGRHPRLVYCAISGFGQTGPRSAEAGYDAMMQAEGGLMSITGARDGPPYRLGVAIADLATALFAVQGILAALIAREKTGRGQLVDVGMLDTVASLLTYQAGIVFATGTSPGRMGNQHPSIAPYETFATADGEFVLAVGNDEQFRRMAALLQEPWLSADPRFATNSDRVHHYDALRAELRRIFATWKRDTVVRALTDAGVPCGAVRSVTETLADPQLAARGMIVPITHPIAGDIRVLGNPLKLSATPLEIRTPPPALGQHTDAILKSDLGLPEEDIARLRRDGAIA